MKYNTSLLLQSPGLVASRACCPEERLVLAILEEAVYDYQKYIGAKNLASKRLFSDAEDWIFDGDEMWYFSFVNICDILKINPAFIRSGLRRWREQRTMIRY